MNAVLAAALLIILTCSLARSADQLSAATQALIEATQRLIDVAQNTCNMGNQKGCDQVLVSQAEILLLRLELRHPSGKINEALADVHDAMSDLEDAVDNE